MKCKCLNPQETDSQVSAISGTPDFTIKGKKKSRVYWKPESHFEEKGWSSWVLGYAYLGGKEIVLNEGRAGWIDYDVLAHEYGHNLGHRHVDGTLMDPYISGMEDGKGGESLSDTSRDVFANMAGAKVMDWRANRSISDLGTVSAHYAKGYTTIKTLGYAGSRYANKDGVDAFYTGYWDGFAEHSGVKDKHINKGQFYG